MLKSNPHSFDYVSDIYFFPVKLDMQVAVSSNSAGLFLVEPPTFFSPLMAKCAYTQDKSDNHS